MSTKTLEIIGAVCLLIITTLLGVLAGLNLGERLSGRYRKRYKQKRKECEATYNELESTRASVREKADEITRLKAKLCDVREEAELLREECVEHEKEILKYFDRYNIVLRTVLHHGLADECNVRLKANRLPTITKTIFDDCIGELNEMKSDA